MTLPEPPSETSSVVRRQYAKPPLLQVTIDLQFAKPDGFEIGQLEDLRPSFSPKYPIVDTVFQGQFLITFPGGPAPTTESTPNGLLFQTDDRRHAFRLTDASLTFTQNAPYTNWEEVVEEYGPICEKFYDLYRPRLINRIGMRYVNRIDIQTQPIELFDYFRIYPSVSSDLPQNITAFFMQTQLLDEPETLVITQTPVPSPSEGMVSLLLDLDVFRSGQQVDSSPDILTVLEGMHEKLDRYFEASITDATRERFA
jgi:uncharacterized protein (TIGR04255 family)